MTPVTGKAGRKRSLEFREEESPLPGTHLPEMFPLTKRTGQYYRQQAFLPGKSQSKTGSASGGRKISQNRQFVRAFQQVQGSTDNLVLKLWIIRPAQGIAKWERHVQGSRRPHFLRDHLQQGEPDRWDSRLLNDAGNQSHGLITHRSGRHQKGRVHPVLPQHLRKTWRGI